MCHTTYKCVTPHPENAFSCTALWYIHVCNTPHSLIQVCHTTHVNASCQIYNCGVSVLFERDDDALWGLTHTNHIYLSFSISLFFPPPSTLCHPIHISLSLSLSLARARARARALSLNLLSPTYHPHSSVHTINGMGYTCDCVPMTWRRRVTRMNVWRTNMCAVRARCQCARVCVCVCVCVCVTVYACVTSCALDGLH